MVFLLLISIQAQGLIDAGIYYPGARVCESRLQSELMIAAQSHAEYQANHQKQGHQLWAQRLRELNRILPGYYFQEICAESWPEDTYKQPHEIGWGMFEAWEYSNGHWKIASTKHDVFGAGMALGRNGIWYACIIVGDNK